MTDDYEYDKDNLIDNKSNKININDLEYYVSRAALVGAQHPEHPILVEHILVSRPARKAGQKTDCWPNYDLRLSNHPGRCGLESAS